MDNTKQYPIKGIKNREGFLKQFKMIPGGLQKSFQNNVLVKTNWALSTYRLKKNGHTVITPAEHELLNTIFFDYGIDYKEKKYIPEAFENLVVI
jgi:hypothetical protein